MPEPTRQDTWTISVTLNNQIIYGDIFDKKTGGEVDSDDTKYYPGAMGPPISLGGRVTIGNVTLQRLYQPERDHANINDWLQAVGSGRVDVTQRPRYITGGEFGKMIHYSGILKRVLVPEVDSEASGPAMLEIEVSPDGVVRAT